jgi:Na+/H+ antiporter NhaD/arsenite permease-like protein
MAVVYAFHAGLDFRNFRRENPPIGFFGRWLSARLDGALPLGVSIAGWLGATFGDEPPTHGITGAAAAYYGYLDEYRANIIEILSVNTSPSTPRGLAEAGAFARASRYLQPLAGQPRLLLAVLALASGLASAFLVNDAICLLMTPFVVPFIRANRLPLKPYLFAIAMGSNAGSAFTLGGNPQNMLVARLSAIPYRTYASAAAIPTSLALAVTIVALLLAFRRPLAAARPPGTAVGGEEPASTNGPARPPGTAVGGEEPASTNGPARPPGTAVGGEEPASTNGTPPLDGALAAACAFALFVLASAAFVGVPLPGAALLAAAIVLVAARARATQILETVDYGVLVFFSALFVLVAALGKTGVVAPLLAALPVLGGARGTWLLTGVLLIGSQIVSNVPLILLLEPYLRHLGDPSTTWIVTALVATFAGNFSLLGSVANVIVFEQARDEAPVGFWEYARIGIPTTLVATTVGVAVFLAIH